MKRSILLMTALAALIATGAAVANLKTGDVTKVSATLSATTAANVQTRTRSCGEETIEVTSGRYTGTATSTTADLNGPVEFHVRSVYNLTSKLGWVEGQLKVRGTDNVSNATFTAINVDGKLDGWLRGNAGRGDGGVFGSLSGSFSKTGGLSDATLGTGSGANAAVIMKAASCKAEDKTRPSVHLLVRGEVATVSSTSISVKPRDGSATQTCAVKSADQVARIELGAQVEMSCVQVAGLWTLAKVRLRG